jgi:predicted phosphodiesterase
MKFALISDIHIDHSGWDWQLLDEVDSATPLVVCGDIENDVRAGSRWLREAGQRFEHVIWVAGNHCMYNLGFHSTRLSDPEFDAQYPYPRTVEEIYDHYSRYSKAHNVSFLHRGSVVVNGVKFVGATGWHDFQAGSPFDFEQQSSAYLHYMNDARYIQWGTEYTVQAIVDSAKADAEYIQNTVTNSAHPVVVLTHHAPNRALLKYNPNPKWVMLNGSYANTLLEPITNSNIRAWCFGHTHDRQDRVLTGVRYINNARGYPGENLGWTPVEIEIAI